MKTLEIFINTNWKQPKLKAVYATNVYFDKFLLSIQWYFVIKFWKKYKPHFDWKRKKKTNNNPRTS